MHRRAYLAVAGTALTGTLAGCMESESSDREESGVDDSDDAPVDDGSDDGGGSGGSDDGGSDDGDDNGDPVEFVEHEWYNNGPYDAGVLGRLENVSGEELAYVVVNVYFLDDDGVQIDEGLANTTDLAADRIWEFDAVYLGDDTNRVDTYEIEWDVTNF